MHPATVFFVAFSGLIALAGLLAAGWAQDYLQAFGLGLFGFGVLFALSCVKRHFDEQDAAKQ